MSSPDARVTVTVYQDGENEPTGLNEVIAAWNEEWKKKYGDSAVLEFAQIVSNLKLGSIQRELPDFLKQISSIRNPDIYFVAEAIGIQSARAATRALELGGIEITTHSPDGSNIDKRYPFLWAARKAGVNAFVATPYSKKRPGGQVNRLPNRHCHRNLEFLGEWKPQDKKCGAVRQILPIRELQDGDAAPGISELLIEWKDIGAFFAHCTAAMLLSSDKQEVGQKLQQAFHARLHKLATACMNVTTLVEASSLLKLNNRWIQVYNTRPDSGHWERGEGQFDSIDGRLMFTLDEISFLKGKDNIPRLEFWLPQLSSGHPWIKEQENRNFKSKRLKNILVVLKEECPTKFADELTSDDWKLLQAHPELVLERLDWKEGVYRVSALVPANKRADVARVGLKNPAKSTLGQIEDLLATPGLYFSTHRAYKQHWRRDLLALAEALPGSAILLVPRIPEGLVASLRKEIRCELLSADQCSKIHLMMLRQIHRVYGGQGEPEDE